MHYPMAATITSISLTAVLKIYAVATTAVPSLSRETHPQPEQLQVLCEILPAMGMRLRPVLPLLQIIPGRQPLPEKIMQFLIVL
jgi:hypothetical protein